MSHDEGEGDAAADLEAAVDRIAAQLEDAGIAVAVGDRATIRRDLMAERARELYRFATLQTGPVTAGEFKSALASAGPGEGGEPVNRQQRRAAARDTRRRGRRW